MFGQKWVLLMLTNDQKRTRLDMSWYVLSHYEDDLGYLIKRDVHKFDPESEKHRKQWKHPGSPPPKTIERSCSREGEDLNLLGWSRVRSRLIILSKVTQWMVHIMQTNLGSCTRKWLERGEKNWLGVFCSCRTMPLPTRHKLPRLLQLSCEILPNPPFSHDSAPSDFYLCPILISHLRGTQYGSGEGVMEAVNEYLVDQENTF